MMNRESDKRVADLLAVMTLEEKIGQMVQVNVHHEPEKWIREHQVGSFLHAMGECTDELQRIATHETRLGIPLLFGVDAIHGHGFWYGATVFPTQLGQSCSWNTALVEEIGRITARDVRATGVHWVFSPVLCIARDMRWGRLGETFGEDPWLIGELGAALVRGLQGGDGGAPDRVIACAKHFAGYSETQGGRDSSEADLSRRKLASFFLPPFERAAREGCATFMIGYQAIDGLACTANRWLLTEKLKGEWGFEGIALTDWDNVGKMVTYMKTHATIREAAIAAIKAGSDMIMATPAFLEAAIEAVGEGDVEEEAVDEAVRRILRIKFALGLFDEQRFSGVAERVTRDIGKAEDLEVAYEAACQSIVLVENHGTLLPLAESVTSIAVVGPVADDTVALLGDWAVGSGQNGLDSGRVPRHLITTVLRGLRERIPDGCDLLHAQGCSAVEEDESRIAEAVATARGAEVVVAVVGETRGHFGECHDRAGLDLPGSQQRLLEALKATGKPLVVVLLASRPLTVPWVADNADAVLVAFNPGMRGGAALASLLFGDRNPCGKLTVSFPRAVGQQPVYYNQIPGWHTTRYVDMDAVALWPFGHGLGYTTFRYAGLSVSAGHLAPGEVLRAWVTIENTGEREGVEIVQLYVNDLVSSLTTPCKELKAFARVALAAGERQEVDLSVPYEAWAMVDTAGERVVESGEFEVMVGPSSRDNDLLRARVRVVGGSGR
jgi:beta-glucosidase